MLESNDWQQYRPKIILVESANFSLENAASEPIYAYLSQKNYIFYAKTFNTIFFRALEARI